MRYLLNTLKFYITAVVLTVILSLITVGQPAEAMTMNGVDMTSLGWDMYGSTESDAMIARMAADRVNWIAFALLNTVDLNSDTVQPFNPSDQSMTGPNANLAHAVATAQGKGLHVALKLHYTDSSGNTLATNLYNPANKAQFFRTYTRNVLAYARFAQAHHVELLILGTEMGGYITDASNRGYFVALIGQVRSVFGGKLSYAANAGELPSYHYAEPASACGWCEEYDEAHWLGFWDLLDYAGLDAYPMLTSAPNPTTAELKAAMTDAPDFLEGTSEHFNQLAHWAGEIARAGKPGIITETGSPSVTGAAYCTGCWPSDSQAINQALQARIYEAIIGSFAARASSINLLGVFPWANNAYNMWGGQPDSRGFTFAAKPAEKIIASTYAAN